MEEQVNKHRVQKIDSMDNQPNRVEDAILGGLTGEGEGSQVFLGFFGAHPGFF